MYVTDRIQKTTIFFGCQEKNILVKNKCFYIFLRKRLSDFQIIYKPSFNPESSAEKFSQLGLAI